MNILLKHRYFRRECIVSTWSVEKAYNWDTLWYIDYNISLKTDSINSVYLCYCCMICQSGRLDDIKTILQQKNNECFLIAFILYKSAEYGHLRIIEYLVQTYPNVLSYYDTTFQKINSVGYRHENRYNYNPLLICAEKGHLEIIQYLKNTLDINIDQVYKCSSFGSLHDCTPEYTMLIVSVIYGHFELVQYLVNHGASINRICNYLALYLVWKHNRTRTLLDLEPLTASLIYGRLEISKYLMEKGASMNFSGWNIHDILRCSASGGHLDTVKFLVELGADIHYEDEGALRLASANGHLPVVQYLVEENGANVNQCENHPQHINCRRPAFMESIENGHYAVSRYLAEHGANIHIYGERALTLCVLKNNLDMVQYLIERGADVHVDHGRAFVWGAREGQFHIVRYMDEHCENMSMWYNDALSRCAYNGHIDIVRYFIEKGVNISETSALQGAAKYGHLGIVQYLVEQGADIHANDDEALCLSAEGGHLEVVQYLVEHGANIHANNDCALLNSVKNRHLHVIRYLCFQEFMGK